MPKSNFGAKKVLVMLIPDFLRHDGTEMRRWQDGGTWREQGPPHPKGAVGHDGVVGLAQQAQI